jgi:hypothetical protein
MNTDVENRLDRRKQWWYRGEGCDADKRGLSVVQHTGGSKRAGRGKAGKEANRKQLEAVQGE